MCWSINRSCSVWAIDVQRHRAGVCAARIVRKAVLAGCEMLDSVNLLGPALTHSLAHVPTLTDEVA